MGSIIFGPKRLADNLTELAGSKAGLALSIEEICDHLTGTEYPDTVREAELGPIRLRAETYEDLYYRLMHRIGFVEEEFLGTSHALAKQFHRYKDHEEDFALFNAVSESMNRMLMEDCGSGPIDAMKILENVRSSFGPKGALMALESFRIMELGIRLNPHHGVGEEWNDVLSLDGLFKGTSKQPEKGRFIDQRYIDYLSNNKDRIGEMHWRKFEQLTAEFYEREGYKVELGPGSGDDGVDVRVWHPGADAADSPLCIAQCKRVKEKIAKVVVKGLHADVEHEKAQYGVIVTTSELSPGARNTISARGYKIEAVERDGVRNWLKKLRTPGTGIVR